MIDDEADDRENQSDAEDNASHQVVFIAKGTAAESRRDDRGDASDGADYQPHVPFHVCQPCEIAKKVLWRAGYQKNDEIEDIPSRGGLKKVHLAELVFRKEDAHYSFANEPDEKKDRHAAQGRGEKTEEGAFKGAESETGHDLQGLSGEKRENDLKHDQADICKLGDKGVGVHKIAEFPGVDGQVQYRLKEDDRYDDCRNDRDADDYTCCDFL